MNSTNPGSGDATGDTTVAADGPSGVANAADSSPPGTDAQPNDPVPTEASDQAPEATLDATFDTTSDGLVIADSRPETSPDSSVPDPGVGACMIDANVPDALLGDAGATTVGCVAWRQRDLRDPGERMRLGLRLSRASTDAHCVRGDGPGALHMRCGNAGRSSADARAVRRDHLVPRGLRIVTR